MKSHSIIQLEPAFAQESCQSITATLPAWFGQPSANERYASGVRERISFGVVAHEKCVGMVAIEFPFPNNGNLYWMAVAREYHGQGVGRSLLAAAEEFVKKCGCQSLTVETLSPKEADENYLKTYNFYTQGGFLPLFELYTYGPDLRMVYLYKSLR